MKHRGRDLAPIARSCGAQGAVEGAARANGKGPERALRASAPPDAGAQRCDWTASVRAAARSLRGFIESFTALETISEARFISEM